MIKKATESDIPALAELAIQMWDDATLSELEEHFAELKNCDDAVCFLKYVEGNPIGFAQCQLRHDYVEGTDTSPVGYLEGIYIQKEFRHQGYARELLHECEEWAKEKNCSEFASDCELSNHDSLCFHMAMGFKEANRIICFKKEL